MKSWPRGHQLAGKDDFPAGLFIIMVRTESLQELGLIYYNIYRILLMTMRVLASMPVMQESNNVKIYYFPDLLFLGLVQVKSVLLVIQAERSGQY